MKSNELHFNLAYHRHLCIFQDTSYRIIRTSLGKLAVCFHLHKRTLSTLFEPVQELAPDMKHAFCE